MNRNPARTLGVAVMAVVLAVAAAACSGSNNDSSGASTSTTVEASTATTNAALGDLSDLDGVAKGLSGGALDCYDLQLAFVALTATPLAAVDGSSQADIDQLQKDLQTLRAQVPAEIVSAFDTYAQGVQAYAEAVKGVDLTKLSDPATQQQITAASAGLDAPEMTAAIDAIETYFAATCPAPAPATTTPS